jgi:predicted DNA-binding transcriptional regulator AlpA
MTEKPLLKPKVAANRLGLSESTPAKLLLTRDEIAAEYGISRRWLELAALRGNGPPMTRISTRMVRYQRGTLEGWLAARTVSNTSDKLEAAK